MLAVLRLFAALCLEVRGGRVSASDLRERVDKIVAGTMNEKEGKDITPLAAAQNRYPELHLHDSVLSDDVLIQVLCEGRIVEEEIDKSLRKNEHFIRPEDEPAWQKVWYGITRPESEFTPAFEKMEEQFAERHFVEWGEVLHVFGLRLWASKIGQLKLTGEQVIEQCQAYIDELRDTRKILHSKPSRNDLFGAYGLGFNEAESKDFKELLDYYFGAIRVAEERLWPSHVDGLMELMASDVHAFFAKVCWTNDDRENTFMVVPIFSVASPSGFVERLLALDPKSQRIALNGLKGRYDVGRLHRELASEKGWLGGVHRLLLEKAQRMSPIRKFAIENEVGRLITPLLGPTLASTEEEGR
jgi:hypothetical protein